jgi:hypothetical protein
LQSSLGSILFPRHDPQAFAFRFIIPMQVLIMFAIFNLQYLFAR